MKTYKSILMLLFSAIVVISCSKSSDQTQTQNLDRLSRGKEIYTAKNVLFAMKTKI